MVEDGDGLCSGHFKIFDVACGEVGLFRLELLSEVVSVHGVDSNDGVLWG